MPSNRRITVPEAGSMNSKEIVYANLKSRIDVVTQDFIQQRCDEKGNIKEQNVDKDILMGMKSLRRRVEEKELLVIPTDKSSMLSVNTVENYVDSMEAHVSKDTIISIEDKKHTEDVLNGHTIQLGRILRVGENHGHESRVKSALLNKSCHVPIMFGLAKNHKVTEPGQPVPHRPVCGADEANNDQLSWLLSGVVTAVSGLMDKDIGTVCRSTEEMLHAIDEVNKRDDIKELTVFSTDVSNMFPSLDIEECAKITAKEFLDSELDINYDEEELALYLAITIDRDKLADLGLTEVVHTRIKSGGSNIGITTKEILSRGPKSKSLFNKPVRQPTTTESRLMFSLALENLIKVAMSEHCYSFNSKLYKQSKGGAIGNILTGCLAVNYMLYWSREFTKKLKLATSNIPSFMLYLMKIYIDDNNIVCESLPPGSRQLTKL